MELGMYSAEILRPTADELFHAIRGYGFTQVQLDLASVCSEQMPREISRELLDEIAAAAQSNGVDVVAINGTFNMIHPDLEVRREGTTRFAVVADACRALGCGLVTLCTGTRSREGMWRWHEDNDTEEAWADLLETMEPIVEIAEAHGLDLGIECEASNTVSSAERARRLMDEMKSPRLKIIMDAANLFHRGEAHRENVRRIIGSAFALLGDEIILAHGKDLHAGEGLEFTSAGRGIVDFDYFLDLLYASGYRDGMILHGMKNEEEFPPSVAFMRAKIASRQRESLP